MNKTRKSAALLSIAITTAAVAVIPLYTHIVSAADHVDAPKTMANRAADITDMYAWHTGDGKVVAILNFASFGEPGLPAAFDPNVVYGIHIDNTGDNKSDKDIWIRFGQESGGGWGMQVTGLPGAAPVVVGPVETTIDAGLGLRVFAGLRDDPFFFDLDGFKETASSGTLSFDNTNDTFSRTNITAIVVEMSLDAVQGAAKSFRLWTTTRVKA